MQSMSGTDRKPAPVTKRQAMKQTTQDITGAMWDSWGRGDLDLLKSMGVNTCLGEIDRWIATLFLLFFFFGWKNLTVGNGAHLWILWTQASHVWQWHASWQQLSNSHRQCHLWMGDPGTTAIGVFWMAPGSETWISLLALVIGVSSKGQTHVTGRLQRILT